MNRTSLRSTSRRFATIALVLASASLAACSSDSILAPAAAPAETASKGLLGDVLSTVTSTVTAGSIQWNTRVTTPYSASATFTAKGGVLEIRELGLKVTVPQNAIPGENLRITVTAVPGANVAYEFEPHGTKFRAPLVFEQNLKGTTWEKKLVKPVLWGGYFANPNQLNANGLASLNELIPTITLGNTVRFDIWHFSGYMVSTGRQSSPTEDASF